MLVATTGIDEVREVELLDPFRFGQGEQIWQLHGIVVGHRKSQADLDAAGLACPDTCKRRRECAVLTAKPVIRCSNAVEAYAHVVEADLRDFVRDRARNRGAVGR